MTTPKKFMTLEQSDELFNFMFRFLNSHLDNVRSNFPRNLTRYVPPMLHDELYKAVEEHLSFHVNRLNEIFKRVRKRYTIPKEKTERGKAKT